MALQLLEQKRKWLQRHLLFKDVTYTSPRIAGENEGFKNWGWSGKVIEVRIGYWNDYFIEITVDWGYAFPVHEDGVFDWPDGPWGKGGTIHLEERQWE